MTFPSRRGLALCTSLAIALGSGAVAPPAATAQDTAQETKLAELGIARKPDTTSLSSRLDGARLDAIPIILIRALMSGIIGRLAYGRFAFDTSSKASRGVPSDLDVEVEDSPEFLLVPDEQLAYTCTLHFVSEARAAGLNPVFYEFEEGTHTYGLFRRELIASWETLGPALGVTAAQPAAQPAAQKG